MWTKNKVKDNKLSLRVTLYRHSLRKKLRKMKSDELNKLYVNLATQPKRFRFAEFWMKQIAIEETLKEFNKRD